jgi:tetratricopeptide (TPR) repeat protein
MNLRVATSEAIDHAIAQFRRAVALDPRYARAWASLGAARSVKALLLGNPELGAKAVEALRKAIEFDPQVAGAHARLANAYTATGQYDEAITAAREAVRLDDSNAAAHLALGLALWYGSGRFEDGISELERAVELNPDSGYGFVQLSLLYAFMGNLQRAETAARTAIELQARGLSGTEGLPVAGAHLRLGYALYRAGKYDEAVREYQREMVFVASAEHVVRERIRIEAELRIAAAYWRKGELAEADYFVERALQTFRARQGRGADNPSTKYYVAAAYALRGDAEHATRYLAESFMPVRALNIARARVDPDFDPVREHPVFQALLQGA